MTVITTSHVGVLLYILGWYASSSILVSSNKVLFDVLGLSIPLLVTFIHFSLTSFLMVIIQKKYPESFGSITVSREEFVRWMIPVAVCTAGDVGLSNMAYSRLPISVMTILKSSAPVCIYITAVLFGIEKFRWKTASICLVIATSVGFAIPGTYKSSSEKEYEYVTGIVLVAIAVVCLALRWVFVQTLTRRYSPHQLLYLIQPTSALILLPFALVIDCDRQLVTKILSHSVSDQVLPIVLILGSSLAAIALLFLEYKIVHHTTSLTLSVAGIGKEILTLFLSALVFDESFTTRQIIAISVSIVGILVYTVLRSRDTMEANVRTSKSSVEFGRIPSGDTVSPPLTPMQLRTISTLTDRSSE
jgi:solute carrier family 35, member C2